MDTLTIQIPESVLLQTGASREALQSESELWLALHSALDVVCNCGPLIALVGEWVRAGADEAGD